jgi:RNA polymerase sigma-70 factor (ECF subfamily)
MRSRRDPLANPEPLIPRVYAYVAYLIGDGPDAEDVTSEVFERALRYRDRYDPEKGEPIAWLMGIARRSIDRVDKPQPVAAEPGEDQDPDDLEEQAVRRLTLASAVQLLDERDRELIAFRYGADLTARQIAELTGERANTVEVALHRALARLRDRIGGQVQNQPPTRSTRPAKAV